MDKQKVIEILKSGQLAVIPTDTQYGLIASALNKPAVEKVYKLRRRNPEKPCIILISSLDDLKLFGIDLNHQPRTMNHLLSLWPNPVSVVLPVSDNNFAYLHRGTNSLAFRMPKNQDLLEIISASGPIIAPSANFEGYPFAKTIDEAKQYFGDQVALYIDQGKLESLPSTVIKIEDGKIEVLRQGTFMIK